MTSPLLFYFLQFLILASALGVVLMPNPIFCALMLAISMIGISALFFSLEAYFVAGVQLIVYAGAVMVLFVMVIMLFNLKSETQAFTKGLLSKVLKTSLSVLIFALIASSVSMSFSDLNASQLQPYENAMRSIKELSALLFTKYVFAFEAISVLLILVIVGAVTLARAKGGTHASNQ